MNTAKKKLYHTEYFIAAAVSFLALFLRWLGLDVISGDFRDCLYPWYLEMAAHGPGIDSMLAYTGDYAMPYVFLIWLLGKLPFPFLYSLKTINIVFDFVLALLAGKIAAFLRPDKQYIFWWGYCVTLLLPNVIINSSAWGQCDVIYTVFLFAAFYCWLQGKYSLMMVMVGLAFSYKLQAVFFLPFLLIAYWLGRKFSLLQFLLIPAVMMAMNLPAVIAGYPLSVTFTRYLGQAGSYPWLYYFYPNLWFFFQAGPYYLFSAGAVLLTAAALLLFVVLLVRKGVAPGPENALPVLFWTAYTCCFFLPSMHERYGYFAELAAVLLAVINIKNAYLPIIMILCTLPKYLFAAGVGENPLWLQGVEAACNTLLYLSYTCVLWRRLFGRDMQVQTQNHNLRGQTDA